VSSGYCIHQTFIGGGGNTVSQQGLCVNSKTHTLISRNRPILIIGKGLSGTIC